MLDKTIKQTAKIQKVCTILKMLGVEYDSTEEGRIWINLQVSGHRIEINQVKGGLEALLAKGDGEFLLDSNIVRPGGTDTLNFNGNLISSVLSLINEDDLEMESIRIEAYEIGYRLFCLKCDYYKNEGCGGQFHSCDCPYVHAADTLIRGVAATRDGFTPPCPFSTFDNEDEDEGEGEILCETHFVGCDNCPTRCGD
jgi:hypothetical protein